MTRCELVVHLEQPPSAVWHALTDQRKLMHWFCEHADVDLDAGRYNFWGCYTIGNPKRGRRKLVAHDRNRRLVYTWRFRDRPTQVEITLSRRNGGGTDLHLNHTGVPEWKWEQGGSVDNFWAGVLATNLRGFLSDGDPGFRYDFSYPSSGGCELTVDVGASRDLVWEIVEETVTLWRSEAHRQGHPVEFLDVDPGRRIGIHQQGGQHEDFTTVIFTLADSGGRTKLTLAQSGFAREDDFTEGHTLGWTGVLHDIKARAEGRTSPHAIVEVIWDTMPAPDGAQILHNSVFGATDAEIQAFADSLGGYHTLLRLVMAGTRDRLDPFDDVTIGYAIDGAGEWTLRVANGKATLQEGIKKPEAVVRMSAIEYLRLIVDDPAAPPVNVEGDLGAVKRLRAMRYGRPAGHAGQT